MQSVCKFKPHRQTDTISFITVTLLFVLTYGFMCEQWRLLFVRKECIVGFLWSAVRSTPVLTAEETRPGPLYLSLSVVCTHAVCVREWGRGTTEALKRVDKKLYSTGSGKTVNKCVFHPMRWNTQAYSRELHSNHFRDICL